MPLPDLVDELSRDLEPARRPPPAAAGLGVWIAASWLAVVGATLAVGPFRPGFGGQLATSPRFLLECLVGFAGPALAMFAALRLGVPGLAPVRRVVAAPLVIAGFWVSLCAYGLLDPALEPAMAGKRPHCFAEALAYATVPFALGVWLMRRSVAIERAVTGAVLGAAAAGIPALVMQLACVYDPLHGLIFHLGPVALVAGIGALIGAHVLPRV